MLTVFVTLGKSRGRPGLAACGRRHEVQGNQRRGVSCRGQIGSALRRRGRGHEFELSEEHDLVEVEPV